MNRRRKAQVGAGIISGVITVAVWVGIGLSGSIADHLPDKWWFVAPFLVACFGFVLLCRWLMNRE